ncbi:uncharacterized protein LOC134773063 [Penaeus indicus]|uniref:uncharacterized protein LOC134773063 n=1 Tax=Penaeus indicus TaxID=29960 RepID=UPI00300CF354
MMMVNHNRTSKSFSKNIKSKHSIFNFEKKWTKKESILPPNNFVSEGIRRGQEREVTVNDRGRSESEISNRQKCQAMFTVDKAGQVWTDDGPYTKLSHQLPPLLESANLSATDPLHSVNLGTRLSLTNGSVPYLPCKVRQYSALDLGSCSAKRATQGKKTWIAFVGDSNGRQKVHSFLTFLPPDLDYVYFLGDKQVTRECFLAFVNDNRFRPPSYDIFGRPKKKKKEMKKKKKKEEEEKEDKEEEEKEDKEEEKEKEKEEEEKEEKKEEEKEEKKKKKKKEEEEEEKKNTHVENPFDQEIFKPSTNWQPSSNLTYSMFPLHDSDPSLEPYDLRVTLVWAPYASFSSPPTKTFRLRVTKFEEWLEQEVVPDVVVLGRVVLGLEVEPAIMQYRWFNLEGGGGVPWEEVLSHNQFRDGIPFMDVWLWLAVFRNTGMWQWDSTVPFNLANYQECYELWNLGLKTDKIYKSKWWHCNDDHHSSYETNAVEIQMLLNLLCNPYIARHEEYCCSESFRNSNRVDQKGYKDCKLDSTASGSRQNSSRKMSDARPGSSTTDLGMKLVIIRDEIKW